jgi:uncharacterized damage-inducible protein DinB
MQDHLAWFQRSFAFDLPLWMAPNILTRLRGTPARVEELTHDVSPALLTSKPNNVWSIQENVGHLADLEPLWLARVDDFRAGKEALTAADLDNRRTHAANHNQSDLASLLTSFRAQRRTLVARLEQSDETDWSRTAAHPRLKTPMRLIDHAFFVAEHDDHHLATIESLLRRAQSGK